MTPRPGLWLVMAAGLSLGLARPGLAVPEAPQLTQHQMVLDGRAITYTAEVGRIPIRDVETGEPHGYMFYVADRLPSSGKPRPVTFVWNGGPGAPATILEFEVAGPKRLVGGRLADNPESWLAATDLVFVDPVGTGFSRPAKAKYAQEFYGTVGDVASVTEFVRAWRILHRAESAPLFLVGESWGAGRAGSVGYALQKRGIDVSGLVLISGGAGLNTPVTPRALGEALRVVDFAATARFHHKLGAEAEQSPQATRRAAETWARQVYAPALDHPDAPSEAERDRVVQGLVRFTGLSPDQIDRKTLSITPRQFRLALLKREGKTLGIFDMRQTHAETEEAGAGPIIDYLRYDLGYLTAEPYLGLQEMTQGYAPDGKYPVSVNARWNYATAQVTPQQVAAAVAEAQRVGGGPPRLGPPLPSVEELVALNPRVKVLVAAGQYDSLNSCAANEETASRLKGALAQAVEFKCYVGGHSMYRDESTRLELSRDVENLIQTATAR